MNAKMLHNIHAEEQAFMGSRIPKKIWPHTGKKDDEVCGATAVQIASDCGQVESSLLYPVSARFRKLIKPLPDHHGRVTFRDPSASNFMPRESKEES
jgi:hypothetical protein